MPNEENREAMKSDCLTVTNPIVKAEAEGVRISFLEQFASESSPEVLGRTAVLLSRADASALKDLLAELLNNSEPMKVSFPSDFGW